MRYIRLPLVWKDDEDEMYTSELYLNPFQIESFYPGVIDFSDEHGIPSNAQVVVINSKNGDCYEVMMTIDTFLMELQAFHSQ